jgi:hypothetical protein
MRDPATMLLDFAQLQTIRVGAAKLAASSRKAALRDQFKICAEVSAARGMEASVDERDLDQVLQSQVGFAWRS